MRDDNSDGIFARNHGVLENLANGSRDVLGLHRDAKKNNKCTESYMRMQKSYSNKPWQPFQ